MSLSNAQEARVRRALDEQGIHDEVFGGPETVLRLIDELGYDEVRSALEGVICEDADGSRPFAAYSSRWGGGWRVLDEDLLARRVEAARARLCAALLVARVASDGGDDDPPF